MYANDSISEKIALVADATIRLMQAEYENFEPEIHRWDWQPGVGLYGLIRAYETLGESRYLDYSRYYVDRLLEAGIVSYSINGAIMFEAVLKLYEHSGETRYKTEMDYFLRWLLRSAAKCQNGCFEHSWTEVDAHLTEQVWIDTLFMGGLVLADSYRLFKREDCLAEVLNQFAAHQACLQDPQSGLFRHLYETTNDTYMAGAYWGRGNGWMAAACIDVLDAIGLDQPLLVDSLQRQMPAVSALQDESGMFHSILDDPQTYLESSATAALGYAALKGSRLGLLDETYQTLGGKALSAILDQIQDNGIVGNVSAGTSGFIAYEAYNTIPIDPRLYGQALAILLLAEALQ